MNHLSPEEESRPWEALTPHETLGLLSKLECKWWIAGGYAIEYFVGKQYREHEDIDILIQRRDLLKLKSTLSKWQLYASDPPGKLRFWDQEEILPNHVHDIWGRKSSSDPWAVQFMINDSKEDSFLYKRNHSITFNIEKFTHKSKDGLLYLAPELQLLHKAKGLRDKDHLDFDKCLPLLSKESLSWLKEMIIECYGSEHIWLNRING